jgi:site-specific DNA-methyltransferase (adenine-specific)
MKGCARLSALTLLHGDCAERLKEVKSQSVDLVVTSPPYAEQRKGKYDGVPADQYVEWFCPIGAEIRRILKPTGSFMLNIKAHCDDGERNLYVMDLVLALKRRVGLKFIDEYVWYKSALPRRKTFRLKNAWEPIYHFALDKSFIDHDAIKIFSKSTFANKRGTACYDPKSGNVGGYHHVADQAPGFTDPDNILYFPTSLLVKDKFPHPAKFPREMVEWLVKGFCPKEGTVLDPFMGSGMTALASLIQKRRCIGIEREEQYVEMTLERLRSYGQPEASVQPDREMIFDSE